jgi:cytochrome P450
VLGGQEIAEGSQLLISYAAANRDPRVFDAPDEVRIDREDNRHLSFGIGRHRCVGMHLAKVVARVAIERVLARLPDYVVDTERIVPYETTPLVNGVVNLPATFTPTARVGASMPAVGPDLPERVRVEPILED